MAPVLFCEIAINCMSSIVFINMNVRKRVFPNVSKSLRQILLNILTVLDGRNVFPICVGAHFSEMIVWICFFLKKEEVGLRG